MKWSTCRRTSVKVPEIRQGLNCQYSVFIDIFMAQQQQINRETEREKKKWTLHEAQVFLVVVRFVHVPDVVSLVVKEESKVVRNALVSWSPDLVKR